MRVHYQWSEDGETRLCVRVDTKADGEGLCYHCDRDIKPGTPISYLVSFGDEAYRMHKSCADRNCTPLSLSMEERLADFYGKPIEEIGRIPGREAWSAAPHLSIDELRGLACFADERRNVWIRTLPEGEMYPAAILEGNSGILAIWGETAKGEWGKEADYGKIWLAYAKKPENL